MTVVMPGLEPTKTVQYVGMVNRGNAKNLVIKVEIFEGKF